MAKNSMDLRRAIRYNLNHKVIKRLEMADIRCEFDFDRNLSGKVVDLSLQGFGIEMHDISGSTADEINKSGNFMMTLWFGSDSITASVKNMWSKVLFIKGNMVIKSGVAIEIISPEDRLKLSGIIEMIRINR